MTEMSEWASVQLTKDELPSCYQLAWRSTDDDAELPRTLVIGQQSSNINLRPTTSVSCVTFHQHKHTRHKQTINTPGTRTAGRLLVRGKIRLPEVEHPKFEGHVTPNEEWNLEVVLEYHNSPLVSWSHAYWWRRQTLKSAIFATFVPL